jgi:DHA1 family bicyclomycin/chloramphenicol resistance-like MFS transporter
LIQTPGFHRWLPFLIAGLATLGPFTIDTYLPSFPAIGADLNASEVMVQQTLTAYLIPFSFMMLFHGALSDAFGRKPVILVGVGGYVIASLGCALATNMTTLLICRALQGLVAGAGTSLARAVVRDAYQGAEAQRLMSRVMLIFAVAPAVAPMIGGALQAWFGWRSIFGFLTLFGAALFIACYRYLPETHPQQARQPFAFFPLLRAYRLVGGSALFLLLASVSALNFAGFFIYVLSAPAFIYKHLGLNEQGFAWLFVGGVIGMMTGSWLSGRFAGKVTPRRTLAYAYALMLAGAVYNNLYYLLFAPAVPWSVLHQVIYGVGMSLAMPSVTLMLLDLFPHNRGMAASLQAAFQSGVIALVAAFAVPVFAVSAPMLAFGALLFVVAGLILWVTVRRMAGEGAGDA